MRTFTDFSKTREFCTDLGARFDPAYFSCAPRAGYVYTGDCYIEQEPDGSFYLQLLQSVHKSAELCDLEWVLFAWVCEEFPEEFSDGGAI